MILLVPPNGIEPLPDDYKSEFLATFANINQRKTTTNTLKYNGYLEISVD